MFMNKADICNTGVCRPGGFTITDRALEFCNFGKNARLLDVGCGLGATVRHVRDKYGLDICGIEKDAEVLAQAYRQPGKLFAGHAENMPFGDGEIDGMLFECSLSKMKDSGSVLVEVSRVLKPKGYLIISDIYARGRPEQLCGLLGRVETKKALFTQLKNNGFCIELFEDYSEQLRATWGQMVFEYGMDALCANLNADRAKMRRVKCGYCLIIAQKERI